MNLHLRDIIFAPKLSHNYNAIRAADPIVHTEDELAQDEIIFIKKNKCQNLPCQIIKFIIKPVIQCGNGLRIKRQIEENL